MHLFLPNPNRYHKPQQRDLGLDPKEDSTGGSSRLGIPALSRTENPNVRGRVGGATSENSLEIQTLPLVPRMTSTPVSGRDTTCCFSLRISTGGTETSCPFSSLARETVFVGRDSQEKGYDTMGGVNSVTLWSVCAAA